ncbi:MAG: carboxypeptidase-like regulatory domain-containing protein, partial [bacterium]
IEIEGGDEEKQNMNTASTVDGTFEFSINEKQNYMIHAEKEGYIPAWHEGGYYAPDPVLVLWRLGIAQGRVIDENDSPVRLAAISIQSATGSDAGVFLKSLKADQEGKFTTHRVLAPGIYEISASQDEYHDLGEGHKQFTVQSPSKEITLQLASKVVTISGVVLEYGTEKGVPGMRVWLRKWEYGSRYSDVIEDATSGVDGRFAFSEVAPGEYGVFADGDSDPTGTYSFSRTFFGIRVSARHDSSDRAVLYVARNAEIHGRVQEKGGDAVSGAEVQCAVMWGSRKATSDEDGSFKLSVPPTSFGKLNHIRLIAEKKVEAETRTGLSSWLELRVGDRLDNVTITLDDYVTIAGRVLTREEEPIANAKVSLSYAFAEGKEETTTNEAGEYEFRNITRAEGLPEAHGYSYYLKIEASGYNKALYVLSAPPGIDNIQRDIHLSPGLSIRGCVTDNEGRHLEGVQISYHDPHTAYYTDVQTNAQGEYVMENLEQGPYEITFHYSQRPLLSGQLFRVPAGTQNADITLEHAVTSLVVTLDIAEGVDRSQQYTAWISRRMEDGRLWPTLITTGHLSSESFSAMIWEPGTYQIRCHTRSCPVAYTWIGIDPKSAQDEIKVTLPIGPESKPNTLIGRVVIPPGMQCGFVSDSLWNHTAVEPDGSFVIRDVSDGPVHLIFWPYDETGIPMRICVQIDTVAEGGRIIDIGEVHLSDWLPH